MFNTDVTQSKLKQDLIEELFNLERVKLVYHISTNRDRFLKYLQNDEGCSRTVAKIVYSLLSVHYGNLEHSIFQVTQSTFIAISRVTNNLENRLKIVDINFDCYCRTRALKKVNFKVTRG